MVEGILDGSQVHAQAPNVPPAGYGLGQIGNGQQPTDPLAAFLAAGGQPPPQQALWSFAEAPQPQSGLWNFGETAPAASLQQQQQQGLSDLLGGGGIRRPPANTNNPFYT